MSTLFIMVAIKLMNKPSLEEEMQLFNKIHESAR